MRVKFRLFILISAIIWLSICLPHAERVRAMPFYDLDPQKIVLRAEFSTDYSRSSEERKHNIALAVKALDGTFIDVGGEFSFNRTVGERSEKRGYKPAKIITKGKFTEGIGGGVCQVSTTLYNALLLADIPVTEFHPHSLTVSYIEPSFDAMVSFGFADLRAVNRTHNPVIVYAAADGERITVRVYGEPLRINVIRKSVVTGEIPLPADEEIVDTDGEYPDLKFGEKLIVGYGKKGLRSEGFLIKTKNGKVIENRKIRKDAYAPIPRTFVIGTDGREETESFLFDRARYENVLTNGVFCDNIT